MIPKILHLYWGRNKKLSYMKYLTALSFSYHNPEWKINVYYPTIPSKGNDTWNSGEQKSYSYQDKDYFDKLEDINRLELISFDFSQFKLPDNISEVHRSDILRLYKLSTDGGLWSDFDIFYTKPVDVLINNSSESETYICYHNNYHSIGFLLASENNSFFAKLLELAKELINIHNSDYQIIGRDLYGAFFKYEPQDIQIAYKTFETNVFNLPFESVYPFKWNEIDKIFGNKKYELNKNTVGIHWFAGASRTSLIENIISDKNLKEYSNLYLIDLMQRFIDK